MNGMNIVLLAGHMPGQARPSLRHCCQQFQLTFIQSMFLLVIDFKLAHSLPQPFIYPFVYQPTCTTLGLTRVCNQRNRMSGSMDSTSLWGAYCGVLRTHPLSVLPSVPTPIPETNTRHHANHALSRIYETKHDTTCHFVPQLKQCRICLH